jgi:cardiolipin synthase
VPESRIKLRNSVIGIMGAYLLLTAAAALLAALFTDRGFGASLLLWTVPVIIVYTVLILLNLDYIKSRDGKIRESFGVSNSLTSARIISVAPMMVSLFHGYMTAGLVIYCLAALTDVLDGIIARRYSQVTLMGVMVDPVGDILSTEAVCVFLWTEGVVPGWLLLLLSVRYFEFFAGLSILAWMQREPPLEATKAGKIVGVVQFSCFTLLLLTEVIPEFGLNSLVENGVFVLLGISFAAVIVSQTTIGLKAIYRE